MKGLNMKNTDNNKRLLKCFQQNIKYFILEKCFSFKPKCAVRVSWLCYTSSSMGKDFLSFDLIKDRWEEKLMRISHETEASLEIVSNKQRCHH